MATEPTCQCRGHGFDPVVWEDPTRSGATEPKQHNYWARVTYSYTSCFSTRDVTARRGPHTATWEQSPARHSRAKPVLSDRDPAEPKIHQRNLKGKVSWVDKDDVVHIHNGILLRQRKNETMPFATMWMDLEMIVWSEVNQKNPNIIWYTYMWNLKKW